MGPEQGGLVLYRAGVEGIPRSCTYYSKEVGPVLGVYIPLNFK